MRTIWTYTAIMIVWLLFSGCRRSYTPHEYFDWAKASESGLSQKKGGHGVIFEMQHRPADLMIVNEIKNGLLAESEYENRKKQLGGLAYFLLKIESGEQDLLMHNVTDEQQYVQRVNYYSLEFQYDIIAVAGSDTLPCVLYQFENAYGITPYINISLAFPSDFSEVNEETSVEILVNDRIFGNGIMKYKYEKDCLTALPELTLE